MLEISGDVPCLKSYLCKIHALESHAGLFRQMHKSI